MQVPVQGDPDVVRRGSFVGFPPVEHPHRRSGPDAPLQLLELVEVRLGGSGLPVPAPWHELFLPEQMFRKGWFHPGPRLVHDAADLALDLIVRRQVGRRLPTLAVRANPQLIALRLPQQRRSQQFARGAVQVDGQHRILAIHPVRRVRIGRQVLPAVVADFRRLSLADEILDLIALPLQ